MTDECRITVAVETPQHAAIGALLDYVAATPLPPGTLVRVPLGRREVPGIVWDHAADPDTAADALRPVVEALQSLPPLDQAWRRLVDFAAAYYQRSVGELALAVLPPELRRLDDRQLARRVAKLAKLPPPEPAATTPAPALTDEQRAAVDALDQATTPALLHGVTGSGKTEVYLHAAERTLAAGPAGAGAGARDQPHAAAGSALRAAFSGPCCWSACTAR